MPTTVAEKPQAGAPRVPFMNRTTRSPSTRSWIFLRRGSLSGMPRELARGGAAVTASLVSAKQIVNHRGVRLAPLLGLPVALGACSADLFHTTEWKSLCDLGE